MTRRDPQRRALCFVRVLFLAAIAVFVMRTAFKALQAPWQGDALPEALAIKVELLPLLFPIHMASGGLALVLVPLAFSMRKWRRWHRIAGRLAALDVILAGLTAFPVALIAPVTSGSALGFSAQGAVWLVLLGLGVANAHRGRIAVHRTCMLLMAAATSGALFFRIFLALWAIFGTPHYYALFYACDAWVAWLLPLSVMAIFLKRTGAWFGNPQ